MDINTKNTPSLLSPAKKEEAVRLRMKKSRLPVRVAAFVLIIIGIFAILAVAAGKLSDGSVKGMLISKLSSLFSHTDSTFTGTGSRAPDTPPTSDLLSVISPTLTSPNESESHSPESTTTAPATESRNETADSRIPEGAIKIVDATIAASSSAIENLTGRRFDTEYLEAMKSSVLLSDGTGPVCLIIHTHTTESYLPLGTKFYHPDSGELARSTLGSENMVAVGKVMADTLNAAGIPTIHITAQHDSNGAGLAYVSSVNTIAACLAKYPSIKYVFDLHRSVERDDSGNLVRDSFSCEAGSLARIRITVSGGSALPDSDVNANLSLALKLNGALCEYSSFLARPVLISDAIYCGGYAPRSLKIDIGSCASALEEAKASAQILAEAVASLLKP